MNYWNIAVVAGEGVAPEAREIRKRIDRSWNSHPDAEFVDIGPDELTESFVEGIDAVVLVVDAEAKHSNLVRPLALLDEVHVPVLALLDKSPTAGSVFESTGVMIDGRDTPGAVLSARIHGMLHRQREVNRLRQSLAIDKISNTGLGDEVRRMHDELELAAQAQRELLPRELPTLHGVSVATLWRPAQYVSGDIYDVIRLDEDHLGLFLADAVGHGVAAALMTMVITQSLTTKLIQGDAYEILDPSDVLCRLNEQMLGHRIHPSRFATAVYAVINCRERKMAIATAGHPPPLLVHEDGGCDMLTTSGGLLGVFEDESYDQVEVELTLGDRLILYTDGFEQAFPGDRDGEAFTKPTLRYRDEFCKLSVGGTPQDVIERVCERLNVQSGSLHQHDDVTLLCLDAGPLSQEDKVPDEKKLAA